jgi:hypothetical protein
MLESVDSGQQLAGVTSEWIPAQDLPEYRVAGSHKACTLASKSPLTPLFQRGEKTSLRQREVGGFEA